METVGPSGTHTIDASVFRTSAEHAGWPREHSLWGWVGLTVAGSHMWCSKQRDTWASIGHTFPNGKMHAKPRTSSATIVPLLWRLDMGSANLLLCLQSGPGRSSQRPTHTYFRLSAPAPANHTKNAFAQHDSKVGCLSASERCKVRRCHSLNGIAPKRIDSLRWHIAALGSEKLQRTGSDCESTIAHIPGCKPVIQLGATSTHGCKQLVLHQKSYVLLSHNAHSITSGSG